MNLLYLYVKFNNYGNKTYYSLKKEGNRKS